MIKRIGGREAAEQKEQQMSVLLNHRSENKLQAYADTLRLVTYTVRMCENEHIFPKKCRWTLCSKILENCFDSLVKIKQANKIRPTTAEQAKFRLKLELQILLNFDALWTLIDIAANAYEIPKEKVGIWSQLMLTADNRVMAWRKNDAAALKKEFDF